MQSQLEANSDIKIFLDKKFPNLETVAKAYVARDKIMNIDFINQKKHCLEKLGYTNDAVQKSINHQFKQRLYSLVDSFLSQPTKDAQYNFLDEFYFGYIRLLP